MRLPDCLNSMLMRFSPAEVGERKKTTGSESASGLDPHDTAVLDVLDFAPADRPLDGEVGGQHEDLHVAHGQRQPA